MNLRSVWKKERYTNKKARYYRMRMNGKRQCLQSHLRGGVQGVATEDSGKKEPGLKRTGWKVLS